MEELHEQPIRVEQTTAAPGVATQGWKQWLGTQEALRWIYLIFGLCAVFLVMTLIQFSTDAVCCGDWDGYYHIRWSQLLWENFSQGKWLPEFKWLPLTVLNPADYADHHFLFHLLQIPFLWFFEPVMAAKIAAVFYASLAVFSVYWLMFRYKVDYLLLWLMALLTCASPFFYRMNMAKAPPLTIIITIIGIYLLFERKYKWLLPLMFVFVWTYSLFPLLFIAAAIWTVIIAWNERKLEWQPVVFTGGGMLLGNVVNPYFPNNFKLFFEHLMTKMTGGSYPVPVGGEWYPYASLDLLTHFPVALAAMLVGYILFAPKNGKLPEKATFFLCFVSLLLGAQFVSKRYAEYFPPFAILFAAFSWQAFRIPNILELPEDFRKEIEPYLDKKKSERQELYETLKLVGVWTLGIFLVVYFVYIVRGVNAFGIEKSGIIGEIRGNEPNLKYKRSMDWAQANIPEGEMIFNCNWDDFPKLFFFNQKHTYAYGLDPNYLYTKNPELYKLIPEITSGRIDEAAPIVRDRFGSNYIFSDAKENQDMLVKALASGWVDKVYEDDEAYILKIRPQKGEAPEDSVDESQLTPEERKILDDEEQKAIEANTSPDLDEEDEQ